MPASALISADQFAQMTKAENENYELVDGQLVPLFSATLLHNIIKDRIVRFVGNYFEKNAVGGAGSETDCRISADTVRRPDLSIFLREEWDQLDLLQLPLPFAPSIAVEVLSPTEHIMDVNRRVRDYLAAGSKEVWLLDYANGELHARTRAGIRLLEGNDMLNSPLLPGFSANVSDLLAGR